MVKVVPEPKTLSSSINPPLRSTACFTIDKPIPVPPSDLDLPLSTL